MCSVAGVVWVIVAGVTAMVALPRGANVLRSDPLLSITTTALNSSLDNSTGHYKLVSGLPEVGLRREW